MRIVFSVILFCFSCQLFGQLKSDSLVYRFSESRIRQEKSAMTVLGAWSLINLGSGVYGRFNSSGSNRYFHEMNALWNSVNVSLAIGGLIKSYKETPTDQIGSEIIKRNRLEKTLLFNAGIDLAYIASGFYLIERSKTPANEVTMNRLNGYGRSLILQGSFLFLFDASFFALSSFQSKFLHERFLIKLAPGYGSLNIYF